MPAFFIGGSMKFQKTKLEIANLLTIIATAVSLLMTVIYATQYATALEKRVALLEQHDAELQERMNDMRDILFQANNVQDEDQARFQDDVQARLAHVDSKIDKIYEILLQAKKNQTI